MYEVRTYDGANDNIGTIIHSANSNDVKLASGSMSVEINAIDLFQLEMYSNNPGYGHIQPFKTLIKVLNTKTNEYDFEGRVLKPNDTMDASGLHSTAFDCEGELGYLHDSVQRHMEFRGTPEALFHTILDYHNENVEEYKRFEVGEINVTNNTNNLYVYLSAEETTFDEIIDKLIDRIGGELQIRKVDGVRYLDLLERIGENSDTEIRLARNLLSMSRSVDPTEVITKLKPLGTRIESEDEEATDASEARLTIADVNGGSPYIIRQDLVDAGFGIRGGSEVWDDITTESALLSAGNSYMNNQKISLNQYTVDALDLSLIDLAVSSFNKGDSYPTINPLMAIDERLRVIGRTIDIISPQNGALTIGDKFKNLYDYEHDNRQTARVVTRLENNVSSLSRSNNQLRTAYEEISNEIQNVQDTVVNVDLEGLPQELQQIYGQLEDINTSIGNLPVYGPVTPLENGLMLADDKAKLDRISVESYVDLDTVVGDIENLNSRVEALENEPSEPEPPIEPEESE